MKIWYKIIERQNKTLKTLFHGVNRSRVLPVNKWLKADIKLVRDGTSKTWYKSGWHIADKNTLENYIKSFTVPRDLIIRPCFAKNVWKKEHSRHNIYLAEYINIINYSRDIDELIMDAKDMLQEMNQGRELW